MSVILHFVQHSSKLQRTMTRKPHAPEQMNSTGATHVKGFQTSWLSSCISCAHQNFAFLPSLSVPTPSLAEFSFNGGDNIT